MRWLAGQLDRDDYTAVVSILRDKDAVAMLSTLATRARRLVATQSSNDRALAAEELAALARGRFEEVEVEPDPAAALTLARAHPPVLVTGSLYLLAELARNEA
jgi:dihydrofolate synthase/folylpolyglutamate synthase